MNRFDQFVPDKTDETLFEHIKSAISLLWTHNFISQQDFKVLRADLNRRYNAEDEK